MNNIPWYKKLFLNTKDLYADEYLGVYQISVISYDDYWSTKTREQITIALYRRFNKNTNETVLLYAKYPGYGKMKFDINAYEKTKTLIFTN